MDAELRELIDRARRRPMTEAEREAQAARWARAEARTPHEGTTRIREIPREPR